MELLPAINVRLDPRAKGARWLLGLLAAVLSLLPGCHRRQQVHRDLYHRELRLQEDEIYRLEDCIKEYQGLVRKHRVEVADLKKQLEKSGTSPTSVTPKRIDPGNIHSVLDSPEDPRPLKSAPETPPIDVPEIDLGEPTKAPELPPIDTPPIDTPAPNTPPIEAPRPTAPTLRYGPSETLPLPGSAEPLTAAPEIAPPVTMPSEPIGDLTVEGYAGAPLKSGESTLVALLRPFSLMGNATSFQGQVSLVLVDPSESLEGQKLARWDFTTGEVADSWRSDAQQPVLDLAIVLPEGAPLDRRLELWVRVEGAEGEKLVRHSEIVLGELASLKPEPLAEVEPDLDKQVEPASMTDQPPPAAWQASDRVAPTANQPNGWRKSTNPHRISVTSPAPSVGMPRAVPNWSPRR